MSCAEVRELLPSYAREREGSLGVRRHLSRCSGCRGELIEYERLLSAMSSLGEATVQPPPALFESLVSIPNNPDRLETLLGHVERNRAAYVGGAAALAAGAAGALLLRRARRTATA